MPGTSQNRASKIWASPFLDCHCIINLRHIEERSFEILDPVQTFIRKALKNGNTRKAYFS
jgi:hypothetical protein